MGKMGKYMVGAFAHQKRPGYRMARLPCYSLQSFISGTAGQNDVLCRDSLLAASRNGLPRRPHRPRRPRRRKPPYWWMLITRIGQPESWEIGNACRP